MTAISRLKVRLSLMRGVWACMPGPSCKVYHYTASDGTPYIAASRVDRNTGYTQEIRVVWGIQGHPLPIAVDDYIAFRSDDKPAGYRSWSQWGGGWVHRVVERIGEELDRDPSAPLYHMCPAVARRTMRRLKGCRVLDLEGHALPRVRVRGYAGDRTMDLSPSGKCRLECVRLPRRVSVQSAQTAADFLDGKYEWHRGSWVPKEEVKP